MQPQKKKQHNHVGVYNCAKRIKLVVVDMGTVLQEKGKTGVSLIIIEKSGFHRVLMSCS